MRRVFAMLLGAVLGVVAGCANPRVTYNEYARIEKGLPVDKLVDRIGPESRREGGRTLFFDGRYGSIAVEIEQGRIVEKWWVEPR